MFQYPIQVRHTTPAGSAHHITFPAHLQLPSKAMAPHKQHSDVALVKPHAAHAREAAPNSAVDSDTPAAQGQAHAPTDSDTQILVESAGYYDYDYAVDALPR